jgi:hypothetical protein
MDATLALAIWGAVTGTVATAGGVVTLIRDRPRMTVTQEIEVPAAPGGGWGEAQLKLLAINDGRQPVTIIDAGFGLAFEHTGRWPHRRRKAVIAHGDVTGPELPIRLEPGAPATWQLGVSAVKVEADSIPQGFAQVSRGSLHLGEPAFTEGLLARAATGTLFGTRRQ